MKPNFINIFGLPAAFRMAVTSFHHQMKLPPFIDYQTAAKVNFEEPYEIACIVEEIRRGRRR